MESASGLATELISNRASKKWIAPILWLILLIWFIKAEYWNPRHVHAHTTSSESSAATTSSASSPSQISTSFSKYGSSASIVTEGWANVTSSNKAAVIVETRASGNIVPLILHFSAVLGPTWPVIIYTSAENFGSFSTSAALIRHQSSGRIVVRPLAEGVWFPNWDSVSYFLTTSWLWEDLAPAEHILLFQSDSVLCSNAVRSVDDFFEYDYIGAPIDPQWGQGYNGGLSLRKRSTIMRVLTEWDYSKNPSPRPEDQWYYARMRDLEDMDIENGLEEGGINLPSMEIARTFAVETIDYPHPLGLHQPTRFLREHILSLDEWCPEYKMATTERIQG